MKILKIIHYQQNRIIAEKEIQKNEYTEVFFEDNLFFLKLIDCETLIFNFRDIKKIIKINTVYFIMKHYFYFVFNNSKSVIQIDKNILDSFSKNNNLTILKLSDALNIKKFKLSLFLNIFKSYSDNVFIMNENLNFSIKQKLKKIFIFISIFIFFQVTLVNFHDEVSAQENRIPVFNEVIEKKNLPEEKNIKINSKDINPVKIKIEPEILIEKNSSRVIDKKIKTKKIYKNKIIKKERNPDYDYLYFKK